MAVTEGVHLLEVDMNPYEGDQFHEPPYTLLFYQLIVKILSEDLIPYFFIMCDNATALLLYTSAKSYLFKSYNRQNDFFSMHLEKELKEGRIRMASCRNAKIFLKWRDVERFATLSYLAYLFNPACIISCIAQTTTVITNMFLAILLYSLVEDKYWISVMCVSIAKVHQVYPVTFLAPVVFKYSYKKGNYKLFSGLMTLMFIVINVIGLFALAMICSGDYSHIHENVYTFILSVENLRPNIGLFWYFFTEMFEHFRDLFIAAFQINVLLLYIIPLSFKFRKDAYFLSIVLILFNGVFKSYPCLGDVAFCFALLPVWTHLFAYLQQGFLVMIVIVITGHLGPVVWHQWIATNSANANFFFGATLCFASAQIFMMTDFLFAFVKREFWIKNNCQGMQKDPKFKLNLE